MRRVRWAVVGVWFLFVLCAAPAAEVDDARIRERYEQMLRERPRQGTSLERLYGMHVEAMDVPDWLDGLSARADENPVDADAALLAGLAWLQHGERAVALEHLQCAAALVPDAAYPRYLLGKVLVQDQAYAAAIEYLTEAAAADAAPDDLVEILTLLGTCYVRTGNLAAGIAAWDRIPALAPGDAQLVEELADVMLEENQVAVAAGYYRRVLENPDLSLYQRVRFTSNLAGIHARLDEVDEAIALYDAVLEQIGPEHWLFDEVLGHIEELFRARGEFDALADFYATRVARHPADVDLLLRLAGVHRLRGDAAAEQATLEQALQRAPSRTDIRWTLAGTLIREHNWTVAADELDRLVRAEPDRLEYRYELGRVLLRGGRRAEGIAWLTRPVDDPARTVEAAEILIEEGLPEDGEALLIRAATLAPDIPDYAERLADFYFALHRADDGLAALKRMVGLPEAPGSAWSRLAESLAQRGYLEQGCAAAREAVRRDPQSFAAGLVLSTLLNRAGRLDDALAETERLLPLAPNDYFAAELSDRRIYLLRRTGQLADAYARQVESLDAESSVEEQMVAARMALALREHTEALRWVDAVVADERASFSEMEAAERTLHDLGEDEQGQALLERMLERAPGRAPDLLRRKYDLYMLAGDLEGAARTADRVIQRLPAGADGYRLAAQVANRTGELEQAFALMQRAARAAPQDAGLRSQFAQMLDAGDLPAEAIEWYWQALDLAEDPGAKLAVIQPLARLYLDLDRYDSLLERLRRWQRTVDDDTTPSLALILAHESVGDLEAAHAELSGLARRYPRDAAVLRRLVKMAEDAGDLDVAVGYQQRLAEVEPSPVQYQRLGDLILSTGDREGALEAWRAARDARGALSPEQQVLEQFEWIDRLWDTGFLKEARAALQDLYASHGGDWRVALRVGAALWEDGDLDAALPVLRGVAEWPAEPALSPGGPDPVDPDEFPPEYETIEQLSTARWLVYQPISRALSSGFGGQGPQDPGQARALALGYLATLRGEHPAYDAWWNELTTGTRDQRRLALEMGVILLESAQTRAMAQAFLDDFPDDRFARFVLITPSRDEMQAGMDEAFLVQVAGQLDWLRRNYPVHAWFYDWHYMSLLVENNDPEPVRAFVEELAHRQDLDPLVLPLVISLLEEVGLHDLFEQYLDQAVVFFRDQGEPTMAAELIELLGRMAVQVIGEGEAESGIRLLAHYLDLSRPETGRRAGNAGGWPGTWSVDDLDKPFPAPTTWWPSARLGNLQRVYQSLAGLGAQDGLREMLQARAAAAEGPDRVGPWLGLAFVEGWDGDAEGAEAALLKAAEAGGGDDELRLLLAHHYLSTRRPEAALVQVRAIETRYGPAHRFVQGCILELATEIGDLAAAGEAAGELMRGRLDADEMSDLADRMTVIGLAEEAERLQRRADRRRSLTRGLAGPTQFAGSPQDRAGRMSRYLQQDQPEKAAAMAVQILRSLPGGPAHEQDTYRKQALDVLRGTGRLEDAVAEVEQEFAAHPDRGGVLESLFVLYQAAGRTDDAMALVDRQLGEGPGVADRRLHFACLFVNENELERAADQVEWLLRRRPDVLFGLAAEYWLIVKAFGYPGGGERLVAALGAMPAERNVWQQAGREQVAGNLINLARDVLNDDRLPKEAVLRLCEWVEPVLSVRYLRDRHAPAVLELKAAALQSMGRPDEAFQNLAECVLGDPVRQRYGLTPAFVPAARPLQGVQWGKDRMDAVVFTFLDAAVAVGKLEALAADVTAALESGRKDLALLAALLRIRLGDQDGFMAVREAAMNDLAESVGRQSIAWARLSQRTLIGQALRDAGQPQAAAEVLRLALVDQRNPNISGMNENLLQYAVDACVEAGRPELARDILLEALDVAAPGPRRGPLETIRVMQVKLKTMRRLLDLGFREDAMDLGLDLLALKQEQQSRYYRDQAEQLLLWIREQGAADPAGAGRIEETMAAAEAEVATAPAALRGWEKLLWLTQMYRSVEDAASVRQRIARQFPDDFAMRFRLAQSALESSRPEEAADDLLAVLGAEPEVIFQRRNAYRELVGVFRESGRLADLAAAIRAIPYARLVLSPGGSRFGRATVVQQAVQFGEHLAQTEPAGPAMALDLVRGLRPVISERPVFQHYISQLDAVLLNAVEMVDWDANRKFEALAALALRPETRLPLGLEAVAPALPLSWTLGMDWEDRSDKGLLPVMLTYARRADRLAELDQACATSEATVDARYLGVLARLARADPPAISRTAVDAAEEAVMRLPAGAADRAYLLLLLGDGLRTANQVAEAEQVLQCGLGLCGRAGEIDGWVRLRGELVEVLRGAGRVDEAVALLLAGRMPRLQGMAADQARLATATIEQDAAQKLLEMDRPAEAWEKARRGLARLAPLQQDHVVEQFRRILAEIEAVYLPRLAEQGQLESVIRGLQDQEAAMGNSVEMLAQVYRMYRANGDDPSVERILEQIRSLRPRDAATRLAAAELFAAEGRTADALGQYQQVLDLAPGLLLQDADRGRRCTALFHAEGKLPAFAQQVADAGLPRLMQGMAGQADGLAEALVGLARDALVEPISAPEVALLLLKPLQEDPGGTVGIQQWRRAVYEAKLDALRALGRKDEALDVLMQLVAPAHVLSRLGVPDRIGAVIPLSRLVTGRGSTIGGLLPEFLNAAEEAGTLPDLVGACREGSAEPPDAVSAVLWLCASLRLDQAEAWNEIEPVRRRVWAEAASEPAAGLCDLLLAGEAERAGMTDAALELLDRGARRAADAGFPAEERRLVLARIDLLVRAGRVEEAVRCLRECELAGRSASVPRGAGAVNRAEFYREAAQRLLTLDRPLAALDRVNQALAAQPGQDSVRSLRTRILRKAFTALAAEGRLTPIVAELDRRLAGEAPAASDWEARYWCARALDDEAGMRAAREQLLERSDRPAVVAVELAGLSLEAGDAEAATDLYLRAWAASPRACLASPTIGRSMAEAFAVTRRLDELAACLAGRPLRELLPARPGSEMGSALAMASRLRRADLNAFAACLQVADWVRAAALTGPEYRGFYLAAEREAETVLMAIDDDPLVFRAYTLRVCSPAWRAALGGGGDPSTGSGQGAAAAYWGQQWQWSGLEVDCMPARWTTLAHRLQRVPELLAALDALASPSPGDTLLAGMLRVRSSHPDDGQDEAVISAARQLTHPDIPDLDLRAMAWIALEWRMADRPAQGLSLLQEVRTEAARRATEGDSSLVKPISLALARILDESGQRPVAVALLQDVPQFADADQAMDYLLAAARALEALHARAGATHHLDRILKTAVGENSHYYHDQAQALIETWENDPSAAGTEQR